MLNTFGFKRPGTKFGTQASANAFQTGLSSRGGKSVEVLHPKQPIGWRQRLTYQIARLPVAGRSIRKSLAAICVLSVAACSSAGDQFAFNQVFEGGAVGDEPRAVLVARDVLASGGSAADAAVAMYATMSVTYPVAAGLGGGGVCLVFDTREQRFESLDFLPRAPISGGPYAIPGAVRGMAALHSRYGRLAWGQLWGIAEREARFEGLASRAFVTRIAALPDGLGADSEFLDIFAPDGQGVTEGQPVEQIDLATVIGAIRSRGAGEFYQGPTARRFIAGANAVGGRLTEEDMRRYGVIWEEPYLRRMPTTFTSVGGESLMLPPLRHRSAQRAAWMWELLLEQNYQADANIADRKEKIVAASSRAMVENRDPRNTSAGRVMTAAIPAGDNVRLIVDGGATAFSTGDSLGQSVSCVTTMNTAFGSKRVAEGTGVVLAPNVDPNAFDMSYAVPVMVVNINNYQVNMVGGASGGTPDVTEVIRALFDVWFGEQLLSDALAAPRVFHAGRPNAIFVEPGISEDIAAGLASQGQVIPVQPYGRVNLMYCPEGMEQEPELCVLDKDPRGFGLSTADLL